MNHGNENLKPIKPGECRNPKGRGKGNLARRTIVRKWLAVKEKGKNPITGQEQWITQADAMVLAMIHQARKGNVRAFQALMNEGFGLNKQIVELEGSIKEPEVMTDDELDNEIQRLESQLGQFDDFEEVE